MKYFCLLIVSGALVGCGGGERKTDQLSAESFFELFIASPHTYTDKEVTITGTVSDRLGKNKSEIAPERVVIEVDPRSQIHCLFPDVRLASIQDLKDMQRVTLKGLCKGRDMFGHIVLEDCSLLAVLKD